ncbi:MAG: hypothetical protein AAGG68_13665 [Bacteroidota bacterium]
MADIRADKLWLIDQIVSVKDAGFIQSLKTVLENHKTEDAASNDFWTELSVAQKQRVELSIQQLENGKGLKHREVMAKFRQNLAV